MFLLCPRLSDTHDSKVRIKPMSEHDKLQAHPVSSKAELVPAALVCTPANSRLELSGADDVADMGMEGICQACPERQQQR